MEERIIKDINNLLAQLFQKMHEAGYKWDAEKKELRKINEGYEVTYNEMAEWKEEQLQHYLEVCIETAEKCENKSIKILLESMKEELGL